MWTSTTDHFKQYSIEIEGRVFTVSLPLYRAKGVTNRGDILTCAITSI